MPARGGKQTFNPKAFKGPRVQLAARIQPDTHERARIAAARLGISLADYVERTLREAPMPPELLADSDQMELSA